ncbi:putative invertase inhibitor [Bienertia sinuspersici]
MGYQYHTISLILIIFLGSSTLTKATNLVPDTCKKITKSDPNINYDSCVKELGSNPRSSIANIDGLAEISFNVTANKARSILSAINQLLKDPKFDRPFKGALEACSGMYSGAPENLKLGLDALKSKDYFTANARVSAAMDCGPYCDEVFKEMKVIVSPLTKENNDYFELGCISLAFTYLFNK